MSYMALYRRWRPQTFDEVVEQDSVVSVLRNAVVQDRIAHAYLFSGTRGTGKTTLAKIFARAINCPHTVNGNPCNRCEICRGIMERRILDVVEIDAASNNGVEDIRSIIENTAYASAVAKYRVYIIDEAHMLSREALNAFLKTLEEPPENVVFILATTEPQKLLVTVLSRCQRYEFKRISREGIARRLKEICDKDGIDATDEALGFLSEKADGALRDAISLLDQAAASAQGRIDLDTARMATGSLDREFLWGFADAVIAADCRKLLEMSHRLFMEGRDPSVFLKELMGVLRDMLIVNTVKDPSGLLYEDSQGIKQLRAMSRGLGAGELTLMIQELSALDGNLRWAVSRQILFEAGILSVADRKWNSANTSFETRLTAVENRLADLVESGLRIARTEGRSDAEEKATGGEAVQAENITEKPAVTHEEEQQGTGSQETEQPDTENGGSDGVGTEARDDAQIAAVRKIPAEEWRRFLDYTSSRGGDVMLIWFEESREQYILPDDKIMFVFDDEMTVRVLKKSSKENLKIVSDCVADVFGGPKEQIFAVEEEKNKIFAEIKKSAAQNGRNREAESVSPVVYPAGRAAPDVKEDNNVSGDDESFLRGAEYFRNLSERISFDIEEQ